MDIPGKIKDLLYLHDCVIIPEFGGFVANYKSAEVDYDRNVFSPPSKEIGFNNQLVHNDGLLISTVSISTGLAYPDARNNVREFVEDVKKRLSKGKNVVFDDLGTFYLGKDKILQFEPDRSTNFLTASFGLSSFEYHELEEYDVRKKIQPKLKNQQVGSNSRRSRILKRSLIAIPILVALALVPIKTDLLNFDLGSLSWKIFEQKELVYEEPKTDKNTLQVAEATFNEPEPNNSTESAEEDIHLAESFTENEILDESVSATETSSIAVERFYVIAGSFKNKGNATRLNNNLINNGYSGRIFEVSNGFFRVAISGHTHFSEAKKQLGEYQAAHPGEHYWILEK
ncbi:MAG: SPOR domain-containing protein [Bacteroidota bacterium]|nr:SPOR domain-containing protein [Bacteroidota bacterium]